MFGNQIANTKHSINRVLNGGMYRVLIPYDETQTYLVGAKVVPYSSLKMQDDGAVSPRLNIIAARPTETIVANWYIYGVSGVVDIRPRDPNTGVPIRGFDGPGPARFTLFTDGEMIVEQIFPEFYGLLDRELTLSFVSGKGNAALTITVEVDFVNSKQTVIQMSSATYTRGGKTVLYFTAPYDATSFTLRFRLSGNRDSSVYIGEVMLQLGHVVDPKFTEDLALRGRPRGAMYLFAGSTVPPGYVIECEGSGRLLYPVAGDARVDGLTRATLGGDATHNHGGKTTTPPFSTTVKETGLSKVDKNHRHAILDGETDPPYVSFLMLRKV